MAQWPSPIHLLTFDVRSVLTMHACTDTHYGYEKNSNKYMSLVAWYNSVMEIGISVLRAYFLYFPAECNINRFILAE